MEHVSSDCTCSGKACTKCKLVLCVGKYFRDKRLKSGLSSSCKDCNSAANKKWREGNREYDSHRHKIYRQENWQRIRTYEDEYARKNKEHRAALKRQRYHNNTNGFRDRVIAFGRRSYTRHKEEIRKRRREYYTKNREKRIALSRAYRQQHPVKYQYQYRPPTEASRQSYRNYYYAHRDERIQSVMQWLKKNPKHHAATQASRRTRKTQAGGSYTPAEWEALKARYGYTCLCCGKHEPDISLTADHVVPVFKHGTSNIENIQPLCRSCNSSKGTKIIDYRNDVKKEKL